MRQLYREVPRPNGVGTTCEKATAEKCEAAFKTWETNTARAKELRQQIAAAKQELESITEECQHTLIYDVAGWMYDERYCGICGRHLGLI